LSFLGIGVQQPVPSLGRLAADGVQAVNTFVGFWWLLVFPCGVLVVALLALNFIGDGLRDALDPKSQAATLI
jgi:ABC-type dipeptide/oligopeptide/nickel transport system permease subunit